MIKNSIIKIFYLLVFISLILFFIELYSYYVGKSEAGFGLFILGLPTTLIVEDLGVIVQKIGFFGWLSVCTIFFFINWFCVLVGLFTFKKFYQKRKILVQKFVKTDENFEKRVKRLSAVSPSPRKTSWKI